MLNILIQWVSGLVALLLANLAAAQTVHIAHCFAGCPAGAPATNEIVVRHLFVASINTQNGLADWVAYRVLPGTVGVASLLPRVWEADALLEDSPQQRQLESGPAVDPQGLASQQDSAYRVNEVVVDPEDRGRLVPMTSFAGTPFWDELNLLSNMAPVPGPLRVGPWSRLDQAINELAARAGNVYVVSGPLYGMPAVAALAVIDASLPAAYFKFIATDAGHAAFVFPRELPQHSDYCGYLMPLAQLQEVSGLQLLPQRAVPGAAPLQRQLGCPTNSSPGSE